MSSCIRCVYLRYEGDGRHICVHRDAQQVLVDGGVGSFKRSEYVDRCPYMGSVLVRGLVGDVEGDVLEEKAARVRVLRGDVDKQGDLF